MTQSPGGALSIELGRKMHRVLSAGLSMDVTWKVYGGLDHWYCVEEAIKNILSFL